MPEPAKLYLDKTGVELTTLINDGLTNEQIKEKFREAGLTLPSKDYLEGYRKATGGNKNTVEFIAGEFKKFLADKLGMEKITDIAILDSIILAGFLALKREMESGKGDENVSVAEMLKALELKGKSFGVAPLSISEKVKSVFRGESIPVADEPEKDKPAVVPENDAFTL